VIGAARIRHLAAESGYRDELVEKVLYLEAILRQFARHPDLDAAWALKGGTALNLFFLGVPRLSVDIDINYVGHGDLDAMQAARPAFEAALAACCEREGCVVRRAPIEHAGGKFRLRYTAAAGGTGSLEVDVNFLLRRPLLALEHRAPRFPPDASGETVPLLALEEIAAGKFTALLTRRAARDAFDADRLLELAPDLLERPSFRLAFVVYAAGSRQDVRRLRPGYEAVTAAEVRRQLLPLLRVEARPFDGDPERIAGRLNKICTAATGRLLAWSDREREFIDRLSDHGEIVAELIADDPASQGLVHEQPLLQWKAQNVREFRKRPGGTSRRPA
jgi:predicted nucleotidyltransferase component of viral defense system